jgi:hypothetical protein
MIPQVSMREALLDRNLLGNAIPGESRKVWRTLLIAAMGEELHDEELEIFKQFTGGREYVPGTMVEEFEAVVGRRGGKSSATGVIVPYIAGLCRHPNLVRGERGVCLIIAQDQRQADICLDYITANFEQSPMLRQLIDDRIQRTLRLKNNINIEVRAADFRGLRGPTYICCVADELAFWQSGESSNPDTEILNAVRPGLATTGGPLVMISSPYAKRGVLWDTYNKHFGKDGDPAILVVQGESRQFNPKLPQRVVDRALEKDPVSAKAEYLAQFRHDIEGFVSQEAVRACVIGYSIEHPPMRSNSYHAFVDPSGGSSDSMCLAIGHYDFSSKVVIVDALREEKPPFSPERVVKDFSALLKSYRINKVVGDKYAGQWCVEAFSRHNILYSQSAEPKSDLYRDLLPLLNSRRIELLDHPKMIAQLLGLERRVSRGGRDSIDHPVGGHDDLANCVAGLAAINTEHGGWDTTYSWVDGPNTAEQANSWYRYQLMQHIANHRWN